MNEEMKELLRKMHELLGQALGETSASSEEISEDMMVLDLEYDEDKLAEILAQLQEAGAVVWVSNEEATVKHVESDLEDEIDFGEGNTSADLSTMVTSEPRGADGYSISSISEKGKHAGFMIGEDVVYSIYKVGETVITQNPYTHEFVHEDYDGTPLYFHITSIAWDGDDETFRYQLGGEDEWISEEWLDKPMVTMMTKVFVPFAATGEDRFVEKETGLQSSITEMLDELAIDTYLSMMSSSSESTRQHAIRMLHKIAEKRDSTTEEAQ